MNRISIKTAALLVVVTAANSDAAPAIVWEAGNGSYGFAIGDVNGDGLGDIVVVNHSGDDQRLFYGSTTGQPKEGVSPFAAGFRSSHFHSVGDFDGDGFNDVLVIADTLSTRRLQIYRGGQSGLTSETIWDAESTISGLVSPAHAIADISGDGRPEIVISSVEPGPNASTRYKLNVFYGGASMTQSSPDFVFPGGDSATYAFADVVSADFEGVGSNQVLWHSSVNNLDKIFAIFRFQNNNTTTRIWLGGAPPRAALAVVDVDSDGDLDIVNASGMLQRYENRSGVLDTIPTVHARVGSGSLSDGLYIGRFDHNDLPDIVSISDEAPIDNTPYGCCTLRLWRDGNLDTPAAMGRILPAITSLPQISVDLASDVDGDSCDEILLRDRAIVVSFCAEDSDGDGIADSFDSCPTVANPEQMPVQCPSGDGLSDGSDNAMGSSGCASGGQPTSTLPCLVTLLACFALRRPSGRRTDSARIPIGVS